MLRLEVMISLIPDNIHLLSHDNYNATTIQIEALAEIIGDSDQNALNGMKEGSKKIGGVLKKG